MPLKKSATVVLALAVTGVVASNANAGVIGWGSSVGGSFFDAARWQSGTVPGPRDDVKFDTRAIYGLSLNKGHKNARMLVGDDAIDLNLNGHRYVLDRDRSGSVLMGLDKSDASGLTLRNGVLKSTKSRLAYAPGSYAAVNVIAGAKWRNTGPLVVGQKGTADMTVSGGVLSSDGGRVGSANGGRGTVTLSGPTSYWFVGKALHVGGDASKGTLTLNAGARVTVRDRLHVGDAGRIVLDGGTLSTRTYKSAGKLVFKQGILELRGQGLTIGDGRQFGEQLDLSTGKTLKLGGASEVNAGAQLNLTGGTFATTETLENRGLIRMTQGSLLAAETATIRNTLAGSGDVQGDLLFTDSGNLILELGGRNPGVSYDRIVVDGDTTLTNVEIQFKNGFVPELGDHFELVVADTVTYAPGFSISLPELPEGLQFDIRQDENCLHAYIVVPEPGTAGLLLTGAGLLIARRRLRR
jgi:T5SS/PEP-CTERM-associated repeat protein